MAIITFTYPHFNSSIALPYIRLQTLKKLNNFAFILHFYFITTLEIFEKYEFLLSYINSKKF